MRYANLTHDNRLPGDICNVALRVKKVPLCMKNVLFVWKRLLYGENALLPEKIPLCLKEYFLWEKNVPLLEKSPFA